MGTLYELTDDLLQLQMYLEEDDEDQAIKDTLEMISQNFEDKIDDYCHVLANYDADEEVLTTEIKRLTERRESVRRAKERMKGAMQSAMLLTNKPKIKTVAYTVYLRKSETVEVPDVTGMDRIDAQDALKKVGLIMDYDRQNCAGEAVYQDIMEGYKVPVGTVVHVQFEVKKKK